MPAAWFVGSPDDEGERCDESPFALNPGQGYIIDNWRYLHGRLTFLGERVMLRTLIK